MGKYEDEALVREGLALQKEETKREQLRIEHEKWKREDNWKRMKSIALLVAIPVTWPYFAFKGLQALGRWWLRQANELEGAAGAMFFLLSMLVAVVSISTPLIIFCSPLKKSEAFVLCEQNWDRQSCTKLLEICPSRREDLIKDCQRGCCHQKNVDIDDCETRDQHCLQACIGQAAFIAEDHLYMDCLARAEEDVCKTLFDTCGTLSSILPGQNGIR